jgi:murein DD-endopeptidase MepM/ murein hydrolase activator NlpD
VSGRTTLVALAFTVATLATPSTSSAQQHAAAPPPFAWGGDVDRSAGEKLAKSVHGELLALIRTPAESRAAKAAELAKKRAVVAIEAWKRFRNPELVELARACIDHPDWHVVHRGLHWARTLGDPTLFERAWSRLDAKEPQIREKAAITCLESFTGASKESGADAKRWSELAQRFEKESDLHVRAALLALRRRLDGSLVPTRTEEEVVVKSEGVLTWTPLLAGFSHLDEVAPDAKLERRSTPGGEEALGLPVAPRWSAPLLGYGHEEVPYIVMQPFGKPRKEGTLYHTGQDVGGCFDGAGVHAAADGVVRCVYSGGDMGTLIAVEHHREPDAADPEPLVTTLYMHCGPTIFVNVGDKVECGQLLGTVGLSYSAENGGHFAHLHFGMYPGGWQSGHDYGYRSSKLPLTDWFDPAVKLAAWTKPASGEGAQH